MKYDLVHCRRNKYCKNSQYKEACMSCKYNVNSTAFPKMDNFKPRVPGIRFLGERTI